MRLRQKPRYINMDRCTACGSCAEKCPMVVPDQYNTGLGDRKAIYKPYAQAIPSAYVIDPVNCRQLGQGKKCGICAKVCPADAVDYEQKETSLEFDVGAVIVAGGFQAFDPSGVDTWLYANHPNVLTAVEFERLLSASGPTAGHLIQPSVMTLRSEIAAEEKQLQKLTSQLSQLEAKHGAPSAAILEGGEAASALGEADRERWLTLTDKAQAIEKRLAVLKERERVAGDPRKIAWLQCVGSRDIHHCSNGYCSAVCCMYAVKEAVIAKGHSTEPLDTAVFFMDMRTYGKDFERYYNDAKAKGVRFIRSRVHTIDSQPDGDALELTYADETGTIKTESFDMVVLSVGLEASASTRRLAEQLGVALDGYHFAATSSFTPVQTSVPGIYACGAFQGPKDIPYSVMEASAAACAASRKLSPARGALVREQTFPQETDVSAEKPRIGVFVCNCGVNIAGVVRVPEVVEYAKTLPHVVHTQENLFSCSQDAQDRLREIIAQQRLNRVVVAACSPRTHEPLFQETLKNAGLNKYLFEMANIRDQDSWVHQNNPDAATLKAKDLVRMAVAKASLLEPLPEERLGITRSALVVGGGIAGINAALGLADQGFPVDLVERGLDLGGEARLIHRTWNGEDVQGYLEDLVGRVRVNPKITVHLETRLTDVKGFVGNFQSTLTLSDGSTNTVAHGVAILATGGRPFNSEEYLHGIHPRVFQWHDVDELIAKKDPLIVEGKCAIFIQCVGSREPQRPYCSKVCCTHSVASAIRLKELNPDMDVYILYRDIRTYGRREDLYQKARSLGVMFIRFPLEEKPRVEADGNGGLRVIVKDPVLGRTIALRPDFINLATAILPSGAEELANLFKVPLNSDRFFLEAHAKLRPVDFATEGVFVCGLAHYPKPIEESIAQALAAASRAAAVLSRDYLETSGLVAGIDPERCVGCKGCLDVCPFGAIDYFEDRHICRVNKALCKGCGGCAATCPSGSVQLMGFRPQQLYAQIDEALAE